MLADRLKAMREAKSWSQAHLADAAGLNVRTVQRIEAGEPASYETLLSLAAALDINVSELGAPETAQPDFINDRRWKVALAAILVAPAVLFIAVNLLRSVAGVAGPFDMIAHIGAKFISFHAFNILSPFIFLGGAAAAFPMCLPAIVRLRASRIYPGAISINGMELRLEWTALIVAAAAFLSAATLLSYAALELIGTR